MTVELILGDCLTSLKLLPDNYVQCVVTSPPYWGLRDYGVDGQIGLEPTPDEYVSKMVDVFREVRRVLKDDGVLWLNLGDSYAGGGRGGQSDEKRSKNWEPTYGHPEWNKLTLKPKDLVGIPWRVAFALQSDGWYLRQDIIWHKPNPMPESVTDRCTKAHEYIFLLTKSGKYYYDHEAVKEDSVDEESKSGIRWRDLRQCDKTGDPKLKQNFYKAEGKVYEKRNRRSVWTVSTAPYKGAHFATFPPKLIEPCILAGSRVGDTVLDPFNGSGTTGQVAIENGRNYIGLELNSDYLELTRERIAKVQPNLWEVK